MEWPSKVAMCTPIAPSHSLTVFSCDLETSREPSGENTTEETAVEWPFKVAMYAPVAPSHSLTVLSYDPEASWEPSGENTMEWICYGSIE